MESTIIKNRKDQMILTLKKEGFDDFNNDILGLADKINDEWWNQHGDKFLKGIKK